MGVKGPLVLGFIVLIYCGYFNFAIAKPGPYQSGRSRTSNNNIGMRFGTGSQGSSSFGTMSGSGNYRYRDVIDNSYRYTPQKDIPLIFPSEHYYESRRNTVNNAAHKPESSAADNWSNQMRNRDFENFESTIRKSLRNDGIKKQGIVSTQSRRVTRLENDAPFDSGSGNIGQGVEGVVKTVASGGFDLMNAVMLGVEDGIKKLNNSEFTQGMNATDEYLNDTMLEDPNNKTENSRTRRIQRFNAGNVKENHTSFGTVLGKNGSDACNGLGVFGGMLEDTIDKAKKEGLINKATSLPNISSGIIESWILILIFNYFHWGFH